MSRRSPAFLFFPLLMLVAYCFAGLGKAQAQQEATSTSATADAQQKNLQQYIELLRSNVRQQKSEIMGAVMQLDVDEAAKFWPIYGDYDKELTRLNDLRAENVKEYARNYGGLTDTTADELISKALDYRRQRIELLAKYYGRVKSALGAIQGARFLQIENQLLEIIDLQIESSLPIAGQEVSTKGE